MGIHFLKLLQIRHHKKVRQFHCFTKSPDSWLDIIDFCSVCVAGNMWCDSSDHHHLLFTITICDEVAGVISPGWQFKKMILNVLLTVLQNLQADNNSSSKKQQKTSRKCAKLNYQPVHWHRRTGTPDIGSDVEHEGCFGVLWAPFVAAYYHQCHLVEKHCTVTLGHGREWR